MAAVAPTPAHAIISRTAVPFVLRAFVLGVFLFAAVGKLFDLPGFQRSLAANDWIPTAFLLPLAVLFIFAELTACALLCGNRTFRTGVILSAFLSLVFTLYTAGKILIGVSAACACFGVFLKLPPWMMLITDAALCIACFALLRMRSAASGAGFETATAHLGQTSRLRLPWLIGLLLLCALGFLKVLPRDPMLRLQIATLLDLSKTRSTYDPITPAMRMNDPKMLSQLPVPTAKGSNPARPTFVVILSNCSLCSLGGMSPAIELGQQFNCNVLLISPNPLPQMQEFAQEHRLHAQLFSDPEGRFQAAYNANWRPRTYLLDKSNHLVWKQDQMRPDMQGMQHALQSTDGKNER